MQHHLSLAGGIHKMIPEAMYNLLCLQWSRNVSIHPFPSLILSVFLPFSANQGAYFNGLVQDYSNSSVLAMELLQSYTKPSIYY